jgi:hypothetical protein
METSVMSITVDAVFDGEVLRPQAPLDLALNRRYSITIDDSDTISEPAGDAWSVLSSLAGTYDGPTDWSEQHDHYIYGAAKHGDAAGG